MKKCRAARWAACLLIFVVMLTFIPMRAHAAQDSDLRQALIDSCTTGEALELESGTVSTDALSELFWELYHGGELPWYTDRQFSYDYIVDTQWATLFRPRLLDPKVYDYNLYEQTVAEILAQTVHPGMSQWQIALNIHDYLIAHYSYDETLSLHKGYDLLVGGSAVCDGYTEAYMDLLNRAGVPCVIVTSESMGDVGHAWNLVQIDGNWYHVDLTWDDPTPNCQGRVYHDYFLKTDEEMRAGDDPHFDWQTELVCADTTYREAFWQGVTSQICYQDSVTCYLRADRDWNSDIRLRDEQSGEQTTLYTDPERYINIGQGKYTYERIGLSLWNGRLYFSNMDTVYSMNTDGTDLTTEFVYDAPGNGKYIYSSFVDRDTIHLTLSDHDFNISRLDVALNATGYHCHSYTAAEHSATCLTDGWITYTCDCGISYRGESLAAPGHQYGSGEVELAATLFKTGLMRYECTGCEESYTEPIEKLTLWQWLGLDELLSNLRLERKTAHSTTPSL